MQNRIVPVAAIPVLLFLGVVPSVFGQVEISLIEETGWETSDEPYDRALISELNSEISRGTYRELNSIIVIKNGELLIESYFNGSSRDDIHNPRSVSKSVAGTMLGIAIREQQIQSTTQTLGDFFDLRQFDEFEESKAEVTLEQLMTMSSGFEAFDFNPESIGNEEYMYPTDNWVEWALNLPMADDREPGDEWFYFTGGVVVLGDILNRMLPGGLEASTHQHLFEPMGIENYQWQYTPQHVANTAGGLSMTPLDFAKFGQLYKDGGRWNGQQLVPESWINESLRVRYATTETDQSYGYLFWERSYAVGDEFHQTFYSSGNGGNKIFILTELPLVVVVTASAYGQSYGHQQVDEIMEKYILPAVVD
ncbi:MAG: serine hydrolase [Pseudomonadales bacterium]|nr:serine hydrolase [Pseudomonadales bacterium]